MTEPSGIALFIVDLVILATLTEWLVLAWMHRRTGRGVNPADIRLNLLSGVALMLALRAALAGPNEWLVLACLMAAGVLHAWDVLSRWRR